MLPAELLQSLQGIKGFEKEAFQKVHQSGEQVTSVRINPLKGVNPAAAFENSLPVPWSSYGYYLAERPSFTLDPLLHAGAYYVQEASGMFLEQCLRQCVDLSRPLKALDLCAAPGGKSTLIQSLISQDSLLVCNEVIKTRVGILEENISKWGGGNCIVTNNDPRDFNRLENYFDVMVIDAPCSGSGLFRRDVSAINEWSAQLVDMCFQRQQRILSDAYTALKREGVLIYSTCSYSREENEDICDWLCDTHDLVSVPVNTLPEWNIAEVISPKHQSFGYRFFPDKLKGEGFFIACFRKRDGDESRLSNKKQKLMGASAKEKAVIQPWLKRPESSGLYCLGKEVFAFPTLLEQELMDLSSALYLRKAGVLIGKIAQDELVPAHEFAVSVLLNDKVVALSLKKEQALQYLRKEEVTIETHYKGWAVVQYNGVNLGWVKALQNRINNYYPKEWRILKSGNN